jgi:predicted glycosyltransferase involved in capsule biosynthesis
MDRFRNFEYIINFLNKYFKTNIIVGELDYQSRVLNPDHKFRYIYWLNTKDYFHRTMVLNRMFNMATTPYVVNYDVDVFTNPLYYLQSVLELRNNNLDVVYPYDGTFIDIKGENINNFGQTLNYESFNKQYMTIMNDKNKNPRFGGCIFFNKNTLLHGGGENENFYSWGKEDIERIFRFNLLDCKIVRITDGPLYHLNHVRLKDSTNKNPLYYLNVKEYDKVTNMSKQQLKKYIKTWSWVS